MCEYQTGGWGVCTGRKPGLGLHTHTSCGSGLEGSGDAYNPGKLAKGGGEKVSTNTPQVQTGYRQGYGGGVGG